VLKATVVAAAALALVLTTQGRPQPAYASVTLTVDNFGDAHAAGGATTCTPGFCTLRAALEIADNRATLVPDLNTTVVIPGPVHTITLTLGALQVGAVQNQVITITGNGSGNSIINLGSCTEGVTSTFCSVLVLDPTPVGNVTAHLSGFTLSGGNTAIGGGGLAGGSASSATPDDTDLTDVTISGNTVTAGNPGGGIAYAQGNLTITNSTISGNTTNGNGGGLDYSGDQTLTIVNSAFTTNSSTLAGAGGGGAIHLLSTSGTYQISSSTFTTNSTPNALAGGGGGAIFSESGTLLHVSNSTFFNNSAGPNGAGGAIFNRLSNATIHFNRFVGNTAHAGLGQSLFENAGTVDAQDNWWSTNRPDLQDGFAGPATHPTAWYVLRLQAPLSMSRSTSTPITADLGHDNATSPAGGNPLVALPNVTTIGVTWPAATLGTVTAADPFLNGSSQAHATFNAGAVPGMAHAFVQIDGFQVDAPIEIAAPPTIAKAFGAASIPVGGITSLTLTLHNPNTVATLTGIQIVDPLPGGFMVSNPNGQASNCPSGTFFDNPGATTVTMTGATLAPGASCTFAINVTASNPGTWANTTGNVSSNEGGTGLTASANLIVVAPPSISKSFTPTSIPINTSSSLQFTITNPGGNTVALTGVGFTDTLPTGLTVANSSAGTCGGTLTTTAPTGITLTGATIATNSQCVFSVTVTGAAGGDYLNTTGAVTSTNGGPGNTASANLTVVAPPTLVKAFGAVTVPLNGTTSLMFTIHNPNASTALTGIGFNDSLPAGLRVANPNGASNTGCGGTFTAAAGGGGMSLSGGSLAAGATCTLSANVTGISPGVKSNTTTAISATESGTGSASNTATITVVAPPDINKNFGAASIPLNGSTSLSFTIDNPNTASALSGVAFSDTLPAGLVVAATPNVTGSCGSGTITATAGSATISLSGGTLTAFPAAGSSCTFSVDVSGIAAGNQVNTSGNVTSTEGGPGATASASTNVVAPPAIAKAFNPTTISLNATTSLTFTLTNPAGNTVALVGVAFTDTLPTGLTVANGASATCGGTLTTTAPTGIALTGATIAANSQCVFSVTVTGAAGGSYTNTTGAVTSTNGGTGNTASANLSVAGPPTIQKTFLVSAQAINIPSTLSFTITNPNGSMALTGVAMSDTLPAGLVVSTPNGMFGSCGAGTITATAGSSTISLTGGTLAAGGNCQFATSVTGTTAGVKSNTTGPVSATESGPGGTSNTATITITSITLSSNNNPATEGITPVTYTAQVQPTPPTGTVTFYDGIAPIPGCSGLTPSPAGMATCNAGIYPTAGNHSVHANYSLGNANSNVVNEVVNDAPLTATAGSNLTGTEAVAIAAGTVLATFTDANPNGAAADFTATVTWGDSAPMPATVTAASDGGFQVTGGHTYGDSGTYPIMVNITDTKGGAMASAALTATIADVPLQITCSQNLNSKVGQQFSGQVASIVDPSNKEPLSEYTITIDWGDGNTSTATFTDPPGTLLVSGSHTYGASGTYTMTVTAREIDPSAAASAASAAGTFTVTALPTFPNTAAPERPFPFGVLLAAILVLALALGLWLRSQRRRRRS
jgi:uncharacterized repeat protein (TIGR01451 family)